MACVGGGSNAIGLFHAFLDDAAGAPDWRGGRRARHCQRASTPRASATRKLGRPGVLHGAYTYLLQDEDGQVALTHSISAGLDYAAVGPEHSYLRQIWPGRVYLRGR